MMANNVGYLTAVEQDEYYTPREVVEQLVPFLPPAARIWCPFDFADSAFVQVFTEAGFHVIHSHVADGQDFFQYFPDEPVDFIISNPPFSKKDVVLRRLRELDIPFAMLMPLPTLQGESRFNDLVGCQALIFDKRINFYLDREHTVIKKGVPFACIFICYHLLEKDLIFKSLKGNKSTKPVKKIGLKRNINR